MTILALADDMTGALEVGAKFSAAGITTTVRTEPTRTASEQAIVYDTETRHLSADEAAQRIKHFVSQSATDGPVLLYKKTDSTLRGNIGAELAALADLFPDTHIGYAPAYPEMGRTVREGVLYVHGVAVAETEFAADLLNPVLVSSIAAVIPEQVRCRIFDGEHQLHVEAAGRTMLADAQIGIMAGPGALAETIAKQIEIPREHRPSMPKVRTCLVLNGSRHPGAALQSLKADAPGWKLLRLNIPFTATAGEVANANSMHALTQIAEHDPDCIFVIGGDTAFAFISALGLQSLKPLGEVARGIPISRISQADIRHVLPNRDRDLLLITKAGGFGEPDILGVVRQNLSRYGD